MAQTHSSIGEGHATNRPPLFKGEDYNYWKTRMSLHIQSVDYKAWNVVVDGNLIPMTTVDKVDVPKKREDMTSADFEMLQTNAKALNILYCGLDAEQFNKVSGCETASQVWKKLEVTYEGTSQVKESKISILTHEYELFSMKNDETISCMFSRFTNIINGLKSLGKVFSNAENVRKVLRSLPESWDAKVIAIQEAKDLTKLELDELLGSLLTHEIMINSRNNKEVKGKKVLAFKGESSIENDISSDEDDEDEDFAMMARNFKKFMKYRKLSRANGKDSSKSRFNKTSPIKCFECNEPGHIKTYCPKLNKGKEDKSKEDKAKLDKAKLDKYKERKRALKAATWDDSSDSSDEETDTAHVCFMASDDEVNLSDSCSSFDDLQESYSELEENFFLLLNDFKVLQKKAKCFRNENLELAKMNETLKKENEDLKLKISLTNDLDGSQNNKFILVDPEKVELKEKVKSLETTIAKFTKSSQTLDTIISKQQGVFNKAGLGYESKGKTFKSFFQKPQPQPCTKCGQLFKDTHTCSLTKVFEINGIKMRKAWVVKGTNGINQ